LSLKSQQGLIPAHIHSSIGGSVKPCSLSLILDVVRMYRLDAFLGGSDSSHLLIGFNRNDMLDQIRIVLVNTTHPGNIGGAARAMKNMGLSDLTLVEPKRFPDPEANARSSRADDILEQAQVVATLEEAIADCQLVIGTSARQRHLSWPLISPRQMSAQIQQDLQQQSDLKVALVFGREDRGLTNEELALCHYHVHIPTEESFSSLNVAAAVQVLAYEIRVAWLESQSVAEPDWQQEWDTEWADGQNVERFYQHLEQTLIDIDFYKPEQSQQLMPKLRRLYQRARLDKVELNILRGILRAVQKSAQDPAQNSTLDSAAVLDAAVDKKESKGSE